jgi:beta-lactamase class A
MPNYYSPSQSSRMPKSQGHASFLLLLLAVLAVVSIGLISQFGNHLSKTPKKVSAASLPTLNPTQAAQLSSQINSVITANSSMDIGVAIQDLNNGQNYKFGERQPFVAASVAKLLSAVAYLHGVQAGIYRPNQLINDQNPNYELQQMIVQSDNDAWAGFNKLITHDGLAAYAKSIGLANYNPDNNTLTASDISLLLGKLYKRQLLNDQLTKQLLSYMHNANEANFIVASIPAGVKVYHKAGWLDDRVHDAAIIDNGKHPYVLVIFTKDISGDYNAAIGHKIYADITKTTTQLFL